MDKSPRFKIQEQSNGTLILDVYSHPRKEYVFDHVLTIEEAEDLAHQLLDAARECRSTSEQSSCQSMNAEDIMELTEEDKKRIKKSCDYHANIFIKNE